jgi:hypothetical protein
MHCAQAIFDLLAPHGICVVIDMNNRFRGASEGTLLLDPALLRPLHVLHSWRSLTDARHVRSIARKASLVLVRKPASQRVEKDSPRVRS